MLSKSKIKFVQSLCQKKYRDELAVFFAEGHKIVTDLLQYFDCHLLIAEKDWLSNNNLNGRIEEIIEAETADLKRISQLKTPPPVLAVFKKANHSQTEKPYLSHLCLALDEIQDPGNVGTILRIADWFGIETVYCSKGCADVYNPKTIQATMGAIARIKVIEVNLVDFLTQLPKEIPIYGSSLTGEIIYIEPLSKNGIIIMGNEGNGISKKIEQLLTKRLYIPNFPIDRKCSDSLNVATATAIICSEFRRR